MLEEELHAEADAQERPFLGDDFADGVDQPKLVEPVHRGTGRADAGENDGVGLAHVSGVRRDGHVRAGGLQRASDGAQIAGSIVDDRDGDTHASTPFVEGIVDGSPVWRVAA